MDISVPSVQEVVIHFISYFLDIQYVIFTSFVHQFLQEEHECKVSVVLVVLGLHDRISQDAAFPYNLIQISLTAIAMAVVNPQFTEPALCTGRGVR